MKNTRVPSLQTQSILRVLPQLSLNELDTVTDAAYQLWLKKRETVFQACFDEYLSLWRCDVNLLRFHEGCKVFRIFNADNEAIFIESSILGDVYPKIQRWAFSRIIGGWPTAVYLQQGFSKSELRGFSFFENESDERVEQLYAALKDDCFSREISKV